MASVGWRYFGLATLVLMFLATCAPAQPQASPTAPPAKAAAQPTAAPPSPTAAPAKPTSGPAQPTEKPAQARPAPFDAKAVADFYRGKTLRFVVGTTAGGAFDVISRLVAKYLPRYIPGNPNVIVENKPGAGGAVAANLLFNVEPKDGTVFANFNESQVLQQALGAPGIEFDGARFNWLGAAVNSFSMCAVRKDVGVDSIRDLMGPNGKEIHIGVVAPGTAGHDTAATLKATLGLTYKIISGYSGETDIFVAIEKKELDGYCTLFTSYKTSPVMNRPDPLLKALIITSPQPVDDPLVKGVPTAESLAPNDEARALIRFVGTPQRFNKPYAAPPGVPQDRVAALRQAFASTFADPEFKADAEKGKHDLSFTSGEEVQRMVQEMLGAPASVLAKVKDILK